MPGPSNAEFFRYLQHDLSFSRFRRSGDQALISFKETIEFALLPEGTLEGPEEGLLFEGVASMSAADWREFIASFVLSKVESRIDPGRAGATRVFATIQLGKPVDLALDTRPSDTAAVDETPIREELRAEAWRYLWTGPSRGAEGGGRLVVHARRIACRGADKGMPARIIFSDKLRQYQRRHRNPAA